MIKYIAEKRHFPQVAVSTVCPTFAPLSTPALEPPADIERGMSVTWRGSVADVCA
jgi:hypothetical protein